MIASLRPLLRYELREAMRRRWLLVYAAGFALVTGAMAYAGISTAGRIGAGVGFGPTAAGLINVNLIVVPLMALVAGALSFARDRERGTLAYLISLPVTLRELIIAKVLALMAALTAAICGGFAVAFAVPAWLHVGGDVGGMLQFATATWLLAMTMAAVGVLISSLCRRTPAALSGAVIAWLAFVVFGDLGIMMTAVATHMGTQALLLMTMLNPLEAFKIASVAALSGSVDVLGPGGRLATDLFGAWLMPVMLAVLFAWGTASMILSWFILERNDVS